MRLAMGATDHDRSGGGRLNQAADRAVGVPLAAGAGVRHEQRVAPVSLTDSTRHRLPRALLGGAWGHELCMGGVTAGRRVIWAGARRFVDAVGEAWWANPVLCFTEHRGRATGWTVKLLTLSSFRCTHLP